MKHLIPVMIILLMVSTAFVGVGTQVDEIRIDEKNQYKQFDNDIFSKIPNEPFYDTIDTPNIWTPKPKTYGTTLNPRTIISKSDDSKYEKRLPLPASKGKTLYVGGSGPGNYSWIQNAIDAASDGDTVFVFSGKYKLFRHGIEIDKSINFIGENKETTIIDGGNLNKVWEGIPIINILVDGVTVSGFTMQNCGGIDQNEDNGIILRSSHNNISGNIFSNNNCGILLFGYPYYASNYNVISDNIFNNVYNGLVVGGAKNNIISDNVFQDDNLVLMESENNIISENIFYDDGVCISSSYHNTFSNNSINDKPLAYLEDESNKVIDIDAGQVILINCYNITVQNKDLSDTAFGIFLDGTCNSHILGNTIESAKYGGIYLFYSNNNNISMNMLSDSSNGIVLTYSNDNIIYSNSITSNHGLGVYLAYSEENNILRNTYTDNNPGLVLTGGANYNDVTDNVFIDDGGVCVYGAWLNIFSNNTLNGKPILYLEEQSDMNVDYDVGQAILVSCDNIKVENQDMSSTYAGIMVVESDNCRILNSTFTSHKRYGIFITHSNNNNVSSNIVTDSNTGIVLEESENNTLFLNSISSSTDLGIYITVESNENTIFKNNIEENDGRSSYCGSVHIDRSFNNSFQCNNFLKNTKGWYFELCSSNYWNGNYWDRPRIFPKLILGKKGLTLLSLEINIDWHPAKEPYEI